MNENSDPKWVHLIPFEGSNYILTDPSTADLTGRTLEFLGNYTNLKKPGKVSKKAVDWLLKDQERTAPGTDAGEYVTYMAHGRH